MVIDAPIHLLTTFSTTYPDQSPEWIVSAPGHEMWVAAAVVEGMQFSIHAPDLDAHTQFDRRSARDKRTCQNRPLPSWSRYLAGVVVTLIDTGMDIPATVAVITGNEPIGPRYDYSLGVTFLCAMV